ncbi:hypothetical protein IJD15_02695 [bacterium]|nr:hypothetical protein [bacterium]
MTNENFEEQQVTGLGINAFRNPEENQELETKQEESCYGKPEKYDYSGVTLPENYCYDENLLNEFNELAGKYNLSQKSANELMSMAVKLTQLTGNNYSKTMAEQQRQKVEGYKHNLINDREIGGANFERTMRTANIAYSQFADTEVQDLLAQAGLNCHPKVVKMFYDIGRRMQDDSIYGVNIAATPKENREDILFPTM